MDGEDDDPEVGEAPSEVAAVARLAPIAAAHHKYAGQRGPWDDDPLPIEALGDDFEYGSELPPPAAWRGVNRALSVPVAKVRPAQGTLGLLQRLSALDEDRRAGASGSGGRASSYAVRRNRPFEFPDDKPIRVRVLDVDALPMEEIHKAFAFTLVRRLPAELCVHVASRIAIFRDNFNQNAYQNLIRDCGRLFGPTHGPELIALFARCHATISVPFLLDYTRRFGTFSRKFIAAQVEQSLNPALFDFIRYQEKGGVRPLPLVVSKPWALSSYTRLMGKSYLKSKLHEQLKLHGHIPSKELEADNADNLPVEVRLAERLSAAGALRVPAPVTASEHRQAQQRPWKNAEAEARRPALLDAIMEAEHSGRGWNPADAEAVRAGLKSAKSRARQEALRLEAGGTAGAAASADALALPAAARPAGAPPEVAPWEDSDDELEELGSFDEAVGRAPSRGSRKAARARVSAGGEKELNKGPRDPDGFDFGPSIGDGRFSLQFEHVVPDSSLGVGENALAELGTGAGAGRGWDVVDALELSDLPERFWSKMRRPFFRHDYRAYRLTGGKWKQVEDPRGPRYKPKRRHRARDEKKEQRQRFAMRSGSAGDTR